MFHDATLGFYNVDKFCDQAVKVTGKHGLCTACPFGDCLHELKPSEKQLILQAPLIDYVYKCNDQGIKPLVPAVPETRIMSWLRRRDIIEPKIRRYGVPANATA